MFSRIAVDGPPCDIAAPVKPTRFFNVKDGLRLMVQNGFDARMICPNGVVRECWGFAARAAMGEPDREEIGRYEAEALALAVSGRKLSDLGLTLFPPSNSNPEDDDIRNAPRPLSPRRFGGTRSSRRSSHVGLNSTTVIT